jgi:hypothetical protein
MSRAALVLAAAVSTTLLSTTAAVAQPAGAQAEVLFRQGRKLLAAGKIAEACDAFEQSEKLEAAVTTLLNLAGCRERNGQLATAWGLFLDVERQTRGVAKDAALHDVAQGRASKLEPRVSKLTIAVAPGSRLDGLEIARGGEPLDSALWNNALPVDGGAFTISAHAPGAAPWSTTVTVKPEGDSKTVDVPRLVSLSPRHDTAATSSSPQPQPQPQPQPTQTFDVNPPPAAHRSLLPPIAMTAATIVVGATALGFDLSSSNLYDEAKAEMSSQSRRTSLENQANSQYQVAQGLAVAGAACAGVAIWLWVRHGHADDARTAIVPTANGIAITGRL